MQIKFWKIFSKTTQQNSETHVFYPNSPWVCSKLKFVRVVVPLALLAEILADS